MKLKSNFVITEVVGTSVAVSTDSKNSEFNGVVRLNETGKRIFELIQQGLEKDAIVATLLDEYDAKEEDVRTEVSSVIEKLINEGVLEA